MKTIRELLTGRPPLTLQPDSSVLDAALAMREHRVGAILVVDGGGSPVGMFTERDLMLRVVVPGLDPRRVVLQEVMSLDLFTGRPEERVSDIAREMQARHIRHLPVVEGGTVLGMLSLRDLLRAHLDAKRYEVRVLQAYIQGEEQPPPASG